MFFKKPRFTCYTIVKKEMFMLFNDFLDLMDTLLGEDGCPWDKEQTHESLRPYLLEECYETIEAINNADMASLCEELGDMLLQVVFHAKLAERAGAFTIKDVIAQVSDKLVSRHTHVFGTDKAVSTQDVIKVWEANKQKESNLGPTGAMRAVPKAMPALTRAAKVLKRSGVGNPATAQLYADINTSLISLRATKDEHFETFGKLMLQIVSLSAILEINAEFSLTNAVEGFINTNSAENPVICGCYKNPKEDVE